MMPPAKPGPSPQGYTPLPGSSSRLAPSLAKRACISRPRQIRTGEEDRVSGAVIRAFGLSKPFSFRPSRGNACASDSDTKEGKHSAMGASITPRAYVGAGFAPFTGAEPPRKLPTRWLGAS